MSYSTSESFTTQMFEFSGTKQLRTVTAMYQADLRHWKRHGCDLLGLLEAIKWAPSCTIIDVDNKLRLSLLGTGSQCVSRPVRCGSALVRRVGNMYFDRDIAETVEFCIRRDRCSDTCTSLLILSHTDTSSRHNKSQNTHFFAFFSPQRTLNNACRMGLDWRGSQTDCSKWEGNVVSLLKNSPKCENFICRRWTSA